jgi:hypothetical protein
MKITSRFDGCTLYECDAKTMRETLERAVTAGAYLDGAYLAGAYLDGAYLDRASLNRAYFNRASLNGASLECASLDGASLYGASFNGASLYGASFNGAKINWQSHALIAEILRRAAGDDVDKRCLVGGILISTDWCWDKMLAIDHPQKQWAIETLLPWIQEGDDAPPELVRFKTADATRKDGD